MELKEFICEVLTSIIGGVEKSRSALKGSGAIIAPLTHPNNDTASHVSYDENGKTRYAYLVEFDVSLGEVQTKGGVGISVSLAGIGVEAESKKGSENASLSRIKFTIPVAYPATKVEVP